MKDGMTVSECAKAIETLVRASETMTRVSSIRSLDVLKELGLIKKTINKLCEKISKFEIE